MNEMPSQDQSKKRNLDVSGNDSASADVSGPSNLKKEREELELEKSKILELKRIVETGRDKLKEEVNKFESLKESLTGSGKVLGKDSASGRQGAIRYIVQ